MSNYLIKYEKKLNKLIKKKDKLEKGNVKIVYYNYQIDSLRNLLNYFKDKKFDKDEAKNILSKNKNIYENLVRLEKTNAKIVKLESKKDKNKLDEYNLEKYKINKLCYEHIILEFSNNDVSKAKIEKALTQEKKKRYQILHGNILSTILMICLPLMLYSFFNSFYNIIDQIMANSIEENAISKIGVISQLKNSVSAFGAGIAGGGGVLVARYYGAGELDHAKKAGANMFLISIIISAIILLILIPLSYPILKIAQTPDITSSTVLYFILCLVELIFVSINNIFIGLEKIKGNSKKILVLNIGMLLIKLIFNVIFVYGIHVKSIIYLEISTMIAQFILFILGVFIMFGKKNMLQIKISNMRPKKIYIKPIISLSIPIFLGKFVMNLGKAVVNGLCGSFYGEATSNMVIGALGVSNNLSGLVTSPVGVFEEGSSTIVSQNIGNKNLKRTISTFKTTLLVAAFFCLIGFVLVRFVFLDQLTSLFSITKNQTKVTQDGLNMGQLIKEIFYFDSISIPALGLTSCLLGLLYGYGKTFLSGILNGSRILIRIISLTILHACGVDYHAAGISMGISNILIGLMSLTFLIIFMVDLKKNGYKGMKISDNLSLDPDFSL